MHDGNRGAGWNPISFSFSHFKCNIYRFNTMSDCHTPNLLQVVLSISYKSCTTILYNYTQVYFLCKYDANIILRIGLHPNGKMKDFTQFFAQVSCSRMYAMHTF